MLEQYKQQQQNKTLEQQKNEEKSSDRKFLNTLLGAFLDKLHLNRIFSVKVSNFPEQKENIKVTNLKEIVIPKTDLKEVENRLLLVQKTIQAIKFPEVKLPEQIDNTKDIKGVENAVKGLKMPQIPDNVKVNNLNELNKSFSALEKAVKGIKLDVKIPEVKDNTKQILDALSQVEKSISSIKLEVPETDFTNVISGLEKVSKTIQEIKFPVPTINTKQIVDAINNMSGDGGGATEATLQSIESKIADAQEPDGSLNVNASLGNLSIDTVPYGIAYGPLEDTGYLYIAYEADDGSWYMKRQDTTTAKWEYVKGASDLATSWADKAGQSWSTYDVVNGVSTAAAVLGSDVTSNNEHIATETTLSTIESQTSNINSNISTLTQDNGAMRNVAMDQINPATEESLQAIDTQLGKLTQIEQSSQTCSDELQDINDRQTDGTQIAQSLMKTGTSTYQVPRLDVSTHSLQTVDYAHHEIHAGSHFFIKGWQDVTSATPVEFLFVTPDTTEYAHAIYKFEGEGEFTVAIYEGATTSADGTPVTIFDNNRNTNNTATCTAFAAPTVTADGTLIRATVFGSGKASGGGSRGEEEIVLKRNTKYLFRFTKVGVGTLWLDWDWKFYEHTDKEA